MVMSSAAEKAYPRAANFGDRVLLFKFVTGYVNVLLIDVNANNSASKSSSGNCGCACADERIEDDVACICTHQNEAFEKMHR